MCPIVELNIYIVLWTSSMWKAYKMEKGLLDKYEKYNDFACFVLFCFSLPAKRSYVVALKSSHGKPLPYISYKVIHW